MTESVGEKDETLDGFFANLIADQPPVKIFGGQSKVRVLPPLPNLLLNLPQISQP